MNADSCANAFAPTMALFGCIGNPVILETNLDIGTICLVLIFVLQLKDLVLFSQSSQLPLMKHSQLFHPSH